MGASSSPKAIRAGQVASRGVRVELAELDLAKVAVVVALRDRVAAYEPEATFVASVAVRLFVALERQRAAALTLVVLLHARLPAVAAEAAQIAGRALGGPAGDLAWVGDPAAVAAIVTVATVAATTAVGGAAAAAAAAARATIVPCA